MQRTGTTASNDHRQHHPIVIVSTISHLFHFIYNLFRTYAAHFIICYYLYLHVLNPESKYGTSQLLTSDSRYSYSVYA